MVMTAMTNYWDGSGDKMHGGSGADQYDIDWSFPDDQHEEIIISDTDTGSIKVGGTELTNQFVILLNGTWHASINNQSITASQSDADIVFSDENNQAIFRLKIDF